LILASGSPQRRAILEQLGVPFEVRVSGADELTDGVSPEAVAAGNAHRKAVAVVTAGESPLPVLGVDTVVELDGRIYGKPAGPEQAVATLRQLSGRQHTVVSGLSLIHGDVERTAVARTGVRFRSLSDAELDAYADTGEWRDRAGGYAIQGRGAMLVSEIHGDYLNVVGLPVAELVRVAPELF
jgi:septum formation protein